MTTGKNKSNFWEFKTMWNDEDKRGRNIEEEIQPSLSNTGDQCVGENSELICLSGPVKPKGKQGVRYLSTDSEKWKTIKIVSGGRSSTGKYADWLNINFMKEIGKMDSIDWRKAWNVLENDIGSVENMIEDHKHLSTDEKESIISEQMIQKRWLKGYKLS